jgi:PIN domain nuclease of toxin-antitoxin system
MMKILLDTHTFLWWILDDPKLSTKALELIGDNRNTLYWSAASSWEVSIKYALGRLPLPEIPEQFLPTELGKNRIESLPIIDAHAFQAGHLPHHHGDPFDRMLVAQAQIESLGLISNDKQLSFYNVDVHW